MTDWFQDPPTHVRKTVRLAGECPRGSSYVVWDGVEWQVGDVWKERGLIGQEVWKAEIFRRIG